MVSMAEMTAEQAVEVGKSLSFEQVWAAIRHFSEEADKRHAETERQIKETERQMKETDKKLDKVTQSVGRLSNTIGELVETLVAARLWEKFTGYNLERAYRRVPIYDEANRAVTEIAILLFDTDCAMAVEVKTAFSKKDVDWHIRRMEFIRRYPSRELNIGDKRVMGAVAGGVVAPEVREYAHECGFFVLELTGESVRLVEAPVGFTPKVW
ncbi:MAG: hypothetical protein LBL06_02140 [Treponema sp.]|nr:hypothetical protein [Treponema sp.]